jgi:hypothetical protein
MGSLLYTIPEKAAQTLVDIEAIKAVNLSHAFA